MRVAVFGVGGKVGRVLVPALERSGHEVQPNDPLGCHAAVDFTAPDAVVGNVRRCLSAGVPVVVGTTGWEPSEVEEAARAAGLPVFCAPNFSLGAVLMIRLAAMASEWFPHAHIVELHADTKRDAPSGTAQATAAAMASVPAISSVRLPGLVAHQEVIFGSEGEVLTIRHDSTSRESFVAGVLLALDRLPSLPPGVTVGLERLL